MAIVKKPLRNLIVVNWGLTSIEYRSSNPWQVLQTCMEGTRGGWNSFLASHGAKCQRIDRGGSVWRIELESVPTALGCDIDEFAILLIERLVGDIFHEPGDQIFVSYASDSTFGHLEWNAPSQSGTKTPGQPTPTGGHP